MNKNNSLEFFFKTFERVLVRSKDVKLAVWNPNIYLYTSEGMHRLLRGPDMHKTHCDILPYNGNEYLAGTNNIPIEPWEPKEDELVAVSEGQGKTWKVRRFHSRDGNMFSCHHEQFAEIQNWPLCEPLRNHFNVPKE